MATGDETQAGPRPSLPPRRPPGVDGYVGDPGATQPVGDADPPFDSRGGFDMGRPPADPYIADPYIAGASKPQILAPQANEWATNMQEVEVVKSRRTGLILLFLLALLAVAVIALGLAAFSVLRGGDDDVAGGSDTSTETTAPGDATSSSVTTPTTTPTTVPDPTKLQVEIIEEPFICDGGTRQFAELSGASPNEEVAFSSPQSPGLSSGTADANGVLPIRWNCEPEQAGTTWELTATGTTSGKSATFIFAGATEPTTPTSAATALRVNLVENPFACNGEARIFGGLTGAEPGEQVTFTSPQATDIAPGTADADGALSIRWVCAPDKAGTTWEVTATGVSSGRSVVFSFTGS
ncbi:MAG: hypothetical protein WBM50_14815 [Acidimicrobiales bacterium]